MGKCKYCGHSAGLFSHVHKECENKHKQGINQLTELIKLIIENPYNNEDWESRIRLLSHDCYLSEIDIQNGIRIALRNTNIEDSLILSSLLRLSELLLQYEMSFSNIKDSALYLINKLLQNESEDFFLKKKNISSIVDNVNTIKQAFSLNGDLLEGPIISGLCWAHILNNISIESIEDYVKKLCQNIPNEKLIKELRPVVQKLADQYFAGELSIEEFQRSTNTITKKYSNLQDIYLESLSKAADSYLSDGILSDEERKRYDTYTDTLKLPLGNLPSKYDDSNILKVCQLGFLSDIKNGKKPEVTVNAPIVLKSKEYYVWVYPNVTAYEEKTKSEWVGRSSGISVRICKGVYYKVGQSRGHKVETSYMTPTTSGYLIVTNQNLILYSSLKSIKVPIKKIISLIPYSDGVEVQRETNTKRLIFEGLDSWFLMNLLSVLDI